MPEETDIKELPIPETEEKKETTVKKPAKKAKNKKPAAPKKKAAKKPGKKKARKVPTPKVKKPEPVKPVKELCEGSTRMRLFRALRKYLSGLSAKQIKEKTGMLPNSGHLATVLDEEVQSKRLKAEKRSDLGDREIIVYFLTAAGSKALKEGTVDGRKHSPERFGRAWTPKRIKAEKALRS